MTTPISYKTTESLFARIKEDLHTYDSLGLIDEGKFYHYVKYIIDHLGVAIYEKKPALLKVEHSKAKLPCDFSLLEAAWKCNSSESTETCTSHFQGGRVYYFEKTCEEIKVDQDSCNIECSKNGEIIDKITIKEYTKGVSNTYNYNTPTLLRVVGGPSRKFCAKKCFNLNSFYGPYYSSNTITLDKEYIYTDFSRQFGCSTNPYIYITYWAFPTDEETGLPLIPDVPVIEQAIEYYIKKRIFENFYLNGDDPDVVGKIKLIEEEYREAIANARYFVKLPSFNDMLNHIRNNRKKFNIYQLA